VEKGQIKPKDQIKILRREVAFGTTFMKFGTKSANLATLSLTEIFSCLQDPVLPLYINNFHQQQRWSLSGLPAGYPAGQWVCNRIRIFENFFQTRVGHR